MTNSTKFIHPQLNDQFAHYLFGNNGFFIEAGAGDMGDATLILEKEYGWKGLIVEPIDELFKSLQLNRRCIVDNSLLWNKTGIQKTFIVPNNRPLYASIQETITDEKKNLFTENVSIKYKITITLNDIIKQYNINNIDYLCLDAEGSELSILQALNFNSIRPKLISIECIEPQEILLQNDYIKVENPFKPKQYGWEFYYLDKNLMRKFI